jgi:dihydrofolate synthase / folylpolyglutamate synthase
LPVRRPSPFPSPRPSSKGSPLSDSLAWLFGLEQFGIKFGLDNIAAILAALNHPERAFRAVHVAGTNGKGSVTAMTDAALRAAGHRTGRYTSPHLVRLNERFAIDGAAVDDVSLEHAVGDVRDEVERLRKTGSLEVHPTFFEVTTAVAFELFKRAAVDIAVCEVGLGGRLDATNVLVPLVTAITSIGFDHQQHLGRTLREIAVEKAGIIKPDVPVVLGKMEPEAQQAIAGVARERHAPLVVASTGAQAREERRADERVLIRLQTPRRDYGPIELALRGAHQTDNALVAVKVLETLDDLGVSVPASAVVKGLEQVAWPGRLEIRRMAGGREALLDAAHNPDGAAALAAFLRTSPFRGCPLVFGAMRDKDLDGMLRALAPETGPIVATRAANARSADAEAIAARARAIRPDAKVIVAHSSREALEAAWRLSPRIVVAGSIFLLGDVMNESGWS